jgi:5-methylcytosine-specific restriction protein A
MPNELEKEFHAEMLSLFKKTGEESKRVSEKSYWPRYFLRDVKKLGGLEYAKKLFAPKVEPQVGFGRLSDLNLIHLSIEYIATLPKWAPLFTPQEIAEARRRLDAAGFIEPADEVNEEGLPEGAKKWVTVNAFERNAEAVLLCKKHYGTQCFICKIDLAEEYGEVARDFIHVHHLKSIAEIAGEYEIKPIEDLRPVCPNCHAILHRRRPQYSIEDVIEFRRLAKLAQQD